MARKPIPLSRVAIANSCFVPPVTGVNGSNIPVSNLYDDSGVFRNRAGSRAKRARTESEIERDAAYDLSRDYPPLSNPEKPCLYPALPPLCYFTSWFLEEFQPKNQRSSFELDESHKAKGLIKRNARAVI